MPDATDALVLELEDLGRRLEAFDPDVDVVDRASRRSNGASGARGNGGAFTACGGRGRGDHRAARPRDPARAPRGRRPVRHRR